LEQPTFIKRKMQVIFCILKKD